MDEPKKNKVSTTRENKSVKDKFEKKTITLFLLLPPSCEFLFSSLHKTKSFSTSVKGGRIQEEEEEEKEKWNKKLRTENIKGKQTYVCSEKIATPKYKQQ